MARAEGERIGVLGGSFDPVHLGHLRLAGEARARLGLDRIILVPAAQQPLKAGRHAPAGDRLAMLRLAAEGRPWLEVSDLETRRAGPSYTFDTLSALRERLGPEGGLWFLAGADVLRDLDLWYRIDDATSLATFVATTRPGHPLEVPPRFEGRVRPLEIDSLPISATEVRRRLARGEPADDLLPAAVAAYIREKGLYR